MCRLFFHAADLAGTCQKVSALQYRAVLDCDLQPRNKPVPHHRGDAQRARLYIHSTWPEQSAVQESVSSRLAITHHSSNLTASRGRSPTSAPRMRASTGGCAGAGCCVLFAFLAVLCGSLLHQVPAQHPANVAMTPQGRTSDRARSLVSRRLGDKPAPYALHSCKACKQGRTARRFHHNNHWRRPVSQSRGLAVLRSRPYRLPAAGDSACTLKTRSCTSHTGPTLTTTRANGPGSCVAGSRSEPRRGKMQK